MANYPMQAPQLQSVMVFVDGTNVRYRIEQAKLKVSSFYSFILTMAAQASGRREIKRIYWYTTQPHLDELKKQHGDNCLDNIRVVLGDIVPRGNPPGSDTPKEKGVDALLVADLIYHAASRNCDVAILVSVDTDFAHAIKRVEDFGCRTCTVGICAEVPDRLKQGSDKTFLFDEAQIILTNSGVKK